jgi:hypothetical protein
VVIFYLTACCDCGKLQQDPLPSFFMTIFTKLHLFIPNAQVLAEGSQPPVLTARFHLPSQATQSGACNKVVLSPAQFHTLHLAVVS